MVLLQLLKDNLTSSLFSLKFWKYKRDGTLAKSRSDTSLAGTQDGLRRLEDDIARLVEKLNHCDDEVPKSREEECVICVSGRASLQTFPCGHIVLCRKCFMRTIQLAVSERNLPLRCIVCRTRIVRIKLQPGPVRPLTFRRNPPVPGTIPLYPSSLWNCSINCNNT